MKKTWKCTVLLKWRKNNEEKTIKISLHIFAETVYADIFLLKNDESWWKSEEILAKNRKTERQYLIVCMHAMI